MYIKRTSREPEKITVFFSKAINGITMAKIYRPGAEMVIIVPKMVAIRSQGFSAEERTTIIQTLEKKKSVIMEVAERQNFEVDLELD